MFTIDVRAPGCAGDLFYGYFNCPKCKAPIQLTVSRAYKVVCACGRVVIAAHPPRQK
jgi:hypothetical protein